MEDHDRRSGGEGGKPLRTLPVEEHLAAPWSEARALLAQEPGVLDRSTNVRRLVTVAEHLDLSLGAKAPARGDEIESFQKARLALSVVARDDVDPWRWLYVDGSDVAKAAERDPPEQKERRQIRIGMMTAT
jgi:hypothetical protein